MSGQQPTTEYRENKIENFFRSIRQMLPIVISMEDNCLLNYKIQCKFDQCLSNIHVNNNCLYSLIYFSNIFAMSIDCSIICMVLCICKGFFRKKI